METKLLCLKQVGWIISKVEEIDGVEIGDPDCKLTEPKFLDMTDLQPLAFKKVFVVRSHDIITLGEPNRETLLKYIESCD